MTKMRFCWQSRYVLCRGDLFLQDAEERIVGNPETLLKIQQRRGGRGGLYGGRAQARAR